MMREYVHLLRWKMYIFEKIHQVVIYKLTVSLK